MSRLRHRIPSPLDAAAAAALALWALIDLTTDGRPTGATAALVLGGLAITLPLAWRQTAPVPAAAAVAAGFVILYAAPDPPDAIWQLLAVLLTAYAIGAHAAGRTALAAAALLAAGVGEAIAVDPSDELANIPPTLVIFLLLPYLAGRALRRRSADAQDAVAAAATAVAQERARIARELHDVVAHSITVIAVQADAAEAALGRDPARAAEPLAVVKRTARDALGEMRHLLTLLREDDVPGGALGPQPGLEGLGRLADQLRAGGLNVEVRAPRPAAAVPPGIDLAAFRVVQEALTNVVRHSGARRAQVDVAVEGGDLVVRVADDGRGGAVGAGGHGLVGMRERAELYGGRLLAGALPDGAGFRVEATFPLPA